MENYNLIGAENLKMLAFRSLESKASYLDNFNSVIIVRFTNERECVIENCHTSAESTSDGNFRNRMSQSLLIV